MTQPPLPPPPSQPPTWGAPPPFPPPPPLAPPFGPPFAAPPRRRRVLPVVLAVVVALGLVTAAVLVPLLLNRDEKETAPDDLSAVKSYDGLTNQHVALGQVPDYPQSPPVGGDHAPVWIECGAYDEPLPVASAVHDLEHGTTWITYRPDDVDADDIALLKERLPANGLLSPYPDQKAPVVVTVWGRQLALRGADDPRLALFVEQFGAGETAPEPFASCNGGVAPDLLPDAPSGGDGPVV